jgi:pyruvate-ferredoxin/flavodoxin oxidoreductase
MIPTLYKLAGQLTPFVLHVAARTIATHALSIFGDHSDVMAVRQTGCAMLCASSVQEAQDFALISHIATLKSRVPFIHFFDGFRTSHEINKIVPLADDTILNLLPQAEIDAHRARALNPEHPVIRGHPQTRIPISSPARRQTRGTTRYDHVEQAMNDFAAATGREYKPFEYYGHPQAERVIVLMGSAIGTCEEVVDELLARRKSWRAESASLSPVLSQTSALCAAGKRTYRGGARPNQRARRARGTALSGRDDRAGRSL